MRKLNLLTLAVLVAVASTCWVACGPTFTCGSVTTSSSSTDTAACAAGIVSSTNATLNSSACGAIAVGSEEVGSTSVCDYKAGATAALDTCTPDSVNELSACNALGGAGTCTATGVTGCTDMNGNPVNCQNELFCTGT